MSIVIQLLFCLGFVPNVKKGGYFFALCVFLQLNDALNPCQLVPLTGHVCDKHHIGSGICKKLVVFLLSQPVNKLFGWCELDKQSGLIENFDSLVEILALGQLVVDPKDELSSGERISWGRESLIELL